MEFDSKSYFEQFLKDNLTMDNSQEIYEVFYSLEAGEEMLFKSCCKILGIDRDKFLANFEGTEIFDVDEDAGLTAIAAAERFGTIVYENPGKPSYGTIKEMFLDNSNSEYWKFRQQLYHSAACDIVQSYDESDYHHTSVLAVVQKMGAYKERKHNLALSNDGLDGVENQDKGIMPERKPSVLTQLQDAKNKAAQEAKQPKTAPNRDNGIEV